MKAPRISATSLWLLLILWHGFALLLLIELAHTRVGWISASTWDWSFREITRGLSRGNISAGAILLLYFYTLMAVTAMLLTYALVQVLAQFIGEGWAGNRVRISISVREPAKREPDAKTDESELGELMNARPELEERIANFRSQIKKVSGIPG